MKGGTFSFSCNHLPYCKCHKVNLNCDGSYIDSLDLIKKQQQNLVNDSDKYTAANPLNHQKIGKKIPK